MPFERLKYCCNHCKQEFNEYHNAVECENQGLPTGELEEMLGNLRKGDKLTFEAEDGMGSRFSYYQDEGEVLARWLVCGNDTNPGHHWCILVKAKFCERTVFIVTNDHGTTQPMSPHEYCYKEGFHKLVRKNNPEINDMPEFQPLEKSDEKTNEKTGDIQDGHSSDNEGK